MPAKPRPEHLYTEAKELLARIHQELVEKYGASVESFPDEINFKRSTLVDILKVNGIWVPLILRGLNLGDKELHVEVKELYNSLDNNVPLRQKFFWKGKRSGYDVPAMAKHISKWAEKRNAYVDANYRNQEAKRKEWLELVASGKVPGVPPETLKQP